MFKIGDFSKFSRVSVRMLRYYDENDIFKPEVVDDYTGYRYYSAGQIQRINIIIRLRDYGFTVLEIGMYLSAPVEVREHMLKGKLKEIDKSIEDEKNKKNRIASAISNLYKEDITMEYKVEIKSIEGMKAISLRNKIESYHHEGILWERIGNYMEQNGIHSTGKCYATYHDTEYKEGDVDVEVLMEVKTLLSDEGEYKFKETESVKKAACVLVPGEYSNISKAFEFLGKWLEDNNKETTGLMRQVPIKGPWNENDPKDYLTEVQCPIK